MFFCFVYVTLHVLSPALILSSGTYPSSSLMFLFSVFHSFRAELLGIRLIYRSISRHVINLAVCSFAD